MFDFDLDSSRARLAVFEAERSEARRSGVARWKPERRGGLLVEPLPMGPARSRASLARLDGSGAALSKRKQRNAPAKQGPKPLPPIPPYPGNRCTVYRSLDAWSGGPGRRRR